MWIPISRTSEIDPESHAVRSPRGRARVPSCPRVVPVMANLVLGYRVRRMDPTSQRHDRDDERAGAAGIARGAARRRRRRRFQRAAVWSVVLVAAVVATDSVVRAVRSWQESRASAARLTESAAQFVILHARLERQREAAAAGAAWQREQLHRAVDDLHALAPVAAEPSPPKRAAAQHALERMLAISTLLAAVCEEVARIVAVERLHESDGADRVALRVPLERCSAQLLDARDRPAREAWRDQTLEARLGRSLLAVGRPDLAHRHLMRALAGRSASGEDDAATLLALSQAFVRVDRIGPALVAAESARRVATDAGATKALVRAEATVGALHRLLGRDEEAVSALRRRVALLKRSWRDDDDAILDATIDLAAALESAGATDEAEAATRRVVERTADRDDDLALRAVVRLLSIVTFGSLDGDADRAEARRRLHRLLETRATTESTLDLDTLVTLVRLDASDVGPLDDALRPLLEHAWERRGDEGRSNPAHRALATAIARFHGRHGRDLEAEFWKLAAGLESRP